ncbi:MAG: DNA-binding protein HU, partial [bacterium (Candidatus Ratteibacteria) CG01_land_8_20_14_3_00_40_19]
MNKKELIEKILSETDISKAQATKAVDSLVNNIRNSLKNGEKV